uniref:Uncharacterized protein n=1 Tax=Fundulus heteroclitus TaxID=8078 RepID=A0A3Q2QD15_FUNHE
IKVKVLYRPTQPMAHHRRVACLILHREPLFLDLIGTCHSAVQRPAILKPEHLVVFKHQWSPGSVRDLPPDHNTLDMLVLITPDLFCCAILFPNQEPNSDPVIPDTPREKCNEMNTDPLTSPSLPFVTIEPSELLFNHKATSSVSTSSALSQCVSITNHSKGKLSLMWTVVQDSPFCVAPSSFELAPLKSTTVRVTYEPSQINTLHGGELECFAYYKVYLWAVNYQILNATGKQMTVMRNTRMNSFYIPFHCVSARLFPGLGLSPPQKLCEVRAQGVYPTLQVTDACSGGSVARLCKQDLWTLFSLDSLNEHLLSTPSAKERTLKTPTKHRSVDVILVIIGQLEFGFNVECVPQFKFFFLRISDNYIRLQCVLNLDLCFLP